jgi:hypothetical protein
MFSAEIGQARFRMEGRGGVFSTAQRTAFAEPHPASLTPGHPPRRRGGKNPRSQRPADGRRRGPAGRADAFTTVGHRKRATARRCAPPQRSRTERRRPVCTAAARAAPPRSGGQRRQNPGGAVRKLAAFAGPDQRRPRPGPGCRRARPRAGHPRRTRRKIENSLLNSLFSGNLPACTPGRVPTGRRIEPGALERVPMRWRCSFAVMRACRGHGEVAQYDRNALSDDRQRAGAKRPVTNGRQACVGSK